MKLAVDAAKPCAVAIYALGQVKTWKQDRQFSGAARMICLHNYNVQLMTTHLVAGKCEEEPFQAVALLQCVNSQVCLCRGIHIGRLSVSNYAHDWRLMTTAGMHAPANLAWKRSHMTITPSAWPELCLMATSKVETAAQQ